MKFTHLHVHSHYSLLDGLAKIDDLVNRAKELGMDALALTDHGNLYGAVEFYKKAKKAGIKPILGVEMYVAPNGRLNRRPKIDEKRYHLILIAKNREGWKNLLQLVTKSHLEGFYYKPRIDRDLLREHARGLICLSGCASGEISKFLAAGETAKAEETAVWHKNIFGDDFYLEISPHAKNLWQPFKNLSEKLAIPLVATGDTHYVRKEDRAAHEVLLAVQTRSSFDDEDRLSLKEYNLSLHSEEEMANIFKDFPDALQRTREITDKCDLTLPLGGTLLPKFPIPNGKKPDEYLAELVAEKLPSRFPKKTKEIEERISHELSVIARTGFAEYFLIVQDVVNWAKLHGIVVGPGRGSAAGSLVSYVLGITNIDPIRYDLLFERFLNEDRVQMPDIDIDFTDIRRDEVIAYVKEKYGEANVAQIITFGTMLARAAVRDAGRAQGMSYGFCDTIAKLIPFNVSINDALKLSPELKKQYDENPDVRRLIDSARKLEGVARHASVHACGVVISPEPLVNYLPLQRAPQGDTTVITQFEMHSIEDLGLLKMDFLGLKNLTLIEQTLKLVREIRGETIILDRIPLDDEKTFALLQKAETTGVFQLESPGMRHYLKELQPSELEDIIVMISLYRPGPMELIPQYIARKFGREKPTYLHPRLKPILSKTYGIGVYQEQMMAIARDLAGFTLSEADTLRKAIGKKIKRLLDEQKEKLISGMVKNGIDKETAEKIWKLFPPFARYGFNRSHAASYALISYQTAYLKAHFPVEFMTSLLNISGNDTDRVNFLTNEAKRMGITVLPPDINASFREFTVDNGNIRFGLLAIKNVGANIVDFIIKDRGAQGPYSSVADFLSRVRHRDLNKKSLESLVKCGAFDSLHENRAELVENLEELLRFNQSAKRISASHQQNLFGTSIANFASLRLRPSKPIEKATMLAWEKELLGFYLTDHPWNAYLAKVSGNTQPIQEALNAAGDAIGFSPRYRIAGIISNIRHIITKTNQPMLFVTIEDADAAIEVLVFANVLEKTAAVWVDGKPVVVEGRLSPRNGEAKLICDRVETL